MGKNPAFMFYPGDWMKDPALGMCSPATRGIWIDILCAMYERDHDRSGIISGTIEQLSRLGRCSPAELKTALDELHKTGAANVTFPLHVTVGNNDVTIASRRLQREHQTRVSTAERVAKHRAKQKCNAPSSSSSSSSSSFSDTKDLSKSMELGRETAPKKPGALRGNAQTLNGDFIAGLKTQTAYEGIDVDRELSKARAWCDVNRRKCTPRFFVNWLNRVERPIETKGNEHGTVIRRNATRNETTYERRRRETAEFLATIEVDPLDPSIAGIPGLLAAGTKSGN
jgi:hypothetical protein